MDVEEEDRRLAKQIEEATERIKNAQTAEAVKRARQKKDELTRIRQEKIKEAFMKLKKRR